MGIPKGPTPQPPFDAHVSSLDGIWGGGGLALNSPERKWLTVKRTERLIHTRWTQPFISRVITHINGLINGFPWGYFTPVSGVISPYL